MYYIGWMMINIHLILAFFIIFGIGLVFKNKHSGKWIVLMSFLLFFIIGHTNIGYIPVKNLENSTEQSQLTESSFDGIILLGGNFSLQHSTDTHPVFNLAASRLFEAIRLALKYPEKRIVFSGTKLEAILTKKYFEEFGINLDRVVIDDQAKTTKDNAKNIKKLINEDAKKTWLLVTSAFHMKRSVALFKNVDVNVIPHPVDYHIKNNIHNKNKSYTFQFERDGFTFWQIGIKEFLGLMELKN
ncbi:MAG: hypothetical protein HEEMFOPI_00492 [Holosporales bacterium]